MKHFTITDWIFIAAIIVLLLIVCGLSFDAKAADCSGSWCVYNELRAEVDAKDDPPPTASLCGNIENAAYNDNPAYTINTKNKKLVEALLLLAARCWAGKMHDYYSAARSLESIRGNSPKIARLWFEMEKSYLDEQTRYCKESAGSCSADDRAELSRRYKALLPINDRLGLPYRKQIEYGVKINKR